MFNRKKGLFIVTAMAALVIASVVRIGQAQKSPPAKAPPAGHAQLASKVAIVGRRLDSPKRGRCVSSWPRLARSIANSRRKTKK